MATLVKCPYCGSYNTGKTTNGKVSDALTKTGAVVGGALINLVTGGSLGIFGTNAIIGNLGTNTAATTAMKLSKPASAQSACARKHANTKINNRQTF